MSFQRLLVFLLKFSLIAAIFGFLIWKAVTTVDADGKNVFQTLWEQPKRFDFIVAAFLLQLFAVSNTFLRWRMLVRALGLSFPLKDAYRLGFLGLLLNLAPMGIVGGDAVKAVLLAKKNPGGGAEAVSSVIVDRIIGLLVMFLCGTIFVLATGFAFREEMLARTFSQIVFGLTIVGYGGVALLFLPPFSFLFTRGHLERLLEAIPVCGGVLAKLTGALLLYRHRRGCLLQVFALSFLVHIPYGISLYFIAGGLFGSVPNLVDHILLYNVTNLTAMIPLAAGPFELVLDQLYPLFNNADGAGTGMVVALGHRIVAILVAGLGIGFYLTSKDEIGGVESGEWKVEN